MILSHHGAACEQAALVALWQEMARVAGGPAQDRAARPAIGELRAVHELLARGASRSPSVLLRFGAGGRRCRACWPRPGDPGRPMELREPVDRRRPGQFTVDDLVDVYGSCRSAIEPRRAALLGSAVFGSPSPAMHATAGDDSVLFPVEIDQLADAEPLRRGLRVRDFGPGRDPTVQGADRAPLRLARRRGGAGGRRHTVRCTAGGWEGFNTDAPAAVALLARARFSGAPHRVSAIVGAGGTARAIGSALVDAAVHSVTLSSPGSPLDASERRRRIGAAARPSGGAPDGRMGRCWCRRRRWEARRRRARTGFRSPAKRCSMGSTPAAGTPLVRGGRADGARRDRRHRLAGRNRVGGKCRFSVLATEARCRRLRRRGAALAASARGRTPQRSGPGTRPAAPSYPRLGRCDCVRGGEFR